MGRAQAALRRGAAACEAAESAAAEAAGARYEWLEMLCLRDLLRWSDEASAAGVTARLRRVLHQLSASEEELVAALHESVISIRA